MVVLAQKSLGQGLKLAMRPSDSTARSTLILLFVLSLMLQIVSLFSFLSGSCAVNAER